MQTFLSTAVILTVLQLAESQRITSLTACMQADKLRLDCRFENKTDNPLRYEFKVAKEREDVIVSTLQNNFFSQKFPDRTSVNISRNMVCLYLSKYVSSDKGNYTCKLQMDNDYTDKQLASVNVMKDVEKCGAVGLMKSVPGLFFLLSLSLLQAANCVSL